MTTTSPGPSVRTDVEELTRWLRLPSRPTAVLWERAPLGDASPDVPGPTDWSLTALLTFSEEEAEKLAAEAARGGRLRRPVRLEPLAWLPAEVKEQLGQAAEPGAQAYRLEGEVFDAGPFGKPPLTHGFLARLGRSPRFLLRLHTM